MKRLILLLLTFGCLISSSFAQDVMVSGKVQSDTVSVGKPFTFNMMMKAPYGSIVDWADFAADTLSEHIDIIKRGEVERTADADSNIIVQQQLTLMTFDTGYVQVPSVGLAYSSSLAGNSRMMAFTKPLTLYSTTIAVDTTLAYKPIVPPIEQPLKFRDMFPWLLGLLLLVLVGFLVRYFIIHRKSKQGENGNQTSGTVIPPYDKAIGDLETLRQQKLWQVGKVKEYYSGLTDIAREYIEGQFGLNAVEMTTDDILQEVKPLHFDDTIFNKLKECMGLADLVKFAKCATTPLENDTAMNDMTDFVKESHAQYQERMAKEAEKQAQEAMAAGAAKEMKEENGDV